MHTPRTADATEGVLVRRSWLVSAIVLACVALLALIAKARFDPPAAKGSDAPPSEFSAARAIELFHTIDGFTEPHPVGSRAHDRLRDALVEHLKRLGLEPELQPALATDGYDTLAAIHNIVVRIPGIGAEQAVMLVAHYDSVAAGPGAGDDGAGVVALLEVARALKLEAPLARPVILLFTDGEELGLLGARAFVREHRLAAEVGVVLNFEGRGTSGPSSMFETSAENGWLIEVLARAVDRPAAVSAAYEVYKRMPNDTDFSVFKRAGMQGLNFAFIGGLRHYHTVLDDVAHLDPRSVQHHGDQALALVRELARSPWPESPRGDRVYCDVLGSFMLSWPVSSGIVIALLCFLGLAWHAHAWIKRGVTTLGACAWGVAGSIAILALCAASGPVITAILGAARGSSEPWAAHPGPVRIAAFSLAFGASFGLVALWLGKRAGFHGMWTGAALVLATLALVLAVSIPGASYCVLIPAVAALTAALACRGFAWVQGGGAVLAHSLPTVASLCAFWIPLELALELSFEWRLAIVNTACAGFVILGCAPALAFATARAAWLGALALLVVAACGVVASLRSPVLSADQPTALNFVHIQSEDQTSSRLIAVTYGAPLPEFPDRRERFERVDRGDVPRWLRGAVFHEASAATWGQDGPFLLLSNPGVQGETRQVNARILSRRGAAGLILELADGVRLVSAAWREQVLPLDDLGARACEFVGFEADGVDLVLEVRGADSVEMELFDVSLDLIRQQRELRAATPQTYVPSGAGDRSIIHRTIRL